jgi:hypothetical protein
MPVNAPPQVVRQVEHLVDQHRQLADEPLLLAIYFEPERDEGDIFLFEVVDGFGAGQVDEDGKLFEVSYGSTPSFPLPSGQRLRLVLTSPGELQVASRNHWPSLEEIRSAVRDGRAMTLFSEPGRPELEALVNG